jgi:hypothetical protein
MKNSLGKHYGPVIMPYAQGKLIKVSYEFKA